MDTLPNELLIVIADMLDLHDRKTFVGICIHMRNLLWSSIVHFMQHREKYNYVLVDIDSIKHIVYKHKYSDISVSLLNILGKKSSYSSCNRVATICVCAGNIEINMDSCIRNKLMYTATPLIPLYRFYCHKFVNGMQIPNKFNDFYMLNFAVQ